MRTTVLVAIAIAAATPLAAQSQQKVVILDNDTLVTIERTDGKSSCTVKVGDQTLAERQAEPICARRQRSLAFQSFELSALQHNLDTARLRVRSLGDSLASRSIALQLNRGRMAEELAAQSLALRSQSQALRSSQLFDNLWRASSQGPIIGVTVDTRPRDTDRWGAYVAAVTPNYPADKAGLRAGDVITSINGQALATGVTGRTQSDGESMVWLRLTELVRKLEPGKAVDLVYRRDNRTVTTRVTPIEDSRRSSASEFPLSVWGFDGERQAAPREPAMAPTVELMGRNFFARTGVLANLELAPLNEKLGQYFGTSRGVLVLSAPGDQLLGLEPGDVVTEVDGRTVDTPNELLRVLRTYDGGKQFTIQVMRQKQRQSITASLP